VVEMISTIEVFKNRVELEKTSLSNRTTKVFTLNGITDATLRFCGINKGREISSEEKAMIKEFWQTISKNIPQWQLILREKISPVELRKDFVVAHSNMLNVLGKVGNVLRNKYPNAWKEKLSKLQDVDWSRNNPDWEGRLVMKGRMLKNTLAIELATNTILQKLGIKLDEDRLKFETMR
jgi:DNA sulfur modification protein DndB